MRYVLILAAAIALVLGVAAPSLAAADVVIYSHRGYQAKAPENTLAAIRMAAGAGSTHVEVDVNFTSNDVPVLMHDLRLERTTNGTGMLERRAYSYVRELDAGSWFAPSFDDQKVPTLWQALRTAKQFGMTVLLDLKGDVTVAEAEKVVGRVRDHGMVGSVYVFSFDRADVNKVNTVEPRFRIGQWLPDVRTPAQVAGLDVVALREDTVTAEYVATMKQAGHTVYAFRALDPATWDRLHQAGVQGWSSSDSRLATNWLASH